MYILPDVPKPGLNLSAVVLHNNITSYMQEWIMQVGKKKKKNQQIPSLRVIKGDIILIGCWIEKHTKCMTTVFHIIVNYAEGEDNVHTYPFKHESYNS